MNMKKTVLREWVATRPLWSLYIRQSHWINTIGGPNDVPRLRVLTFRAIRLLYGNPEYATK